LRLKGDEIAWLGCSTDVVELLRGCREGTGLGAALTGLLTNGEVVGEEATFGADTGVLGIGALEPLPLFTGIGSGAFFTAAAGALEVKFR
jgi:hypothetical protein